MKSYILLSQIKVENANAVAGFTYGFPAISHFLGFTHALSRELAKCHALNLGGCAVVSHEQHVNIHPLKYWGDSSFSTSRNPLNEKGNPPSFIEEGKMHLTISLLLECDFDLDDIDDAGFDSKAEFYDHLKMLIFKQRLAGGTILDLRDISFKELPQGEEQLRKFTRRELLKLLPGYLIVDRSKIFEEHIEKNLTSDEHTPDMVDAWLDFSSIRYSASSGINDKAEAVDEGKTEWSIQSRPFSGWLVPITVGYKAISDTYSPGKVANVRDTSAPFRFVEALYTIGEWISPHRIKDISQIFWRYKALPEQGLYLCKNDYELQSS